MSYSALTITRRIFGEVQQHRFVAVDDTRAGAGENTLGVAQAYGMDEDTAVDVLGVVRIETGGAVADGALIESDAEGRAITRSSGAVVARVLDGTTAAGQKALCVLIPN